MTRDSLVSMSRAEFGHDSVSVVADGLYAYGRAELERWQWYYCFEDDSGERNKSLPALTYRSITSWMTVCILFCGLRRSSDWFGIHPPVCNHGWKCMQMQKRTQAELHTQGLFRHLVSEFRLSSPIIHQQHELALLLFYGNICAWIS